MQKLRSRISSFFSTVICYVSPGTGVVFHIVGCNRGIQIGTGGFAALDGTAANEQREHYRTMLESICAENGIDSVLEEDGGPEETAGPQVAAQLGIPWSDINTTKDDKKEMGIPQDYVAGPYSAEQRSEWNRQREEFMVARIKAQRGNAKSSMVICGFAHLDRLAELLGHCGAQVHKWDYRNLAWYQPGVFAEDP